MDGLSGGSAVRVTGPMAEPGSRRAAGLLWRNILPIPVTGMLGSAAFHTMVPWQILGYFY